MSGRENRFDGVSGTDGEGALLDNDGVALGASGHLPSRGLDPAEIAGLPGTHAPGFGWCVDREEHHVGIRDRGIHLCREVEIPTTTASNDLVQARLVNGETGEVWVVPSIDALLIQVNDGDLDLGATVGDDGHGRAANVASTDAANGADHVVQKPT